MESKKYNFFDTKLNKCVLTIEMNRLEKRNAFSPVLLMSYVIFGTISKIVMK